jgi:predicted MPP superfamily phosphohydrolase
MNTQPIKKFLLSVFKALFYCFLLFVAVAAYAILIEPTWLKIRTISLNSVPSVRIVHFSDIHYKGTSNYLTRVVNHINALKPDFVCFTGDLAEKPEYLDEALNIISGIHTPVFGCPGNHDHWNKSSLDRIRSAFRTTGGAWLDGNSVAFTNADNTVTITDGRQSYANMITRHTFHVCLLHYPAHVPEAPTNTFDLILAGHSHGGQVRLPFFGALVLPSGVGDYDQGLFNTSAGLLYVNPGIGTFLLPVRLFCRPEITVIEL